MIVAPLHPNEKDRLRKLYEYDILDTEAEQAFDDLTSLASEICGTPISLISLVDPDRQWFKSKIGLEANETERDIAFCSHAVLQDEIFEVEDASKDERFADNPLVTGSPDIRFYAGMPLKSPEGLPIGTLCVIDKKPNKLNDHQRKALAILSREVIGQLELRLKTKRLEHANQQKTEFLSNMSHEIRTPLNAIIGFTEILLADKSSYLKNDKAIQYMESIDFSGKHLLSMINAVLDLSKIEAGKMDLEPAAINLVDTMDNLLQMLRVKAEQQGINIQHVHESDSQYDTWIDSGKFSQVIINLVNNAIKFSSPDSTIVISLHVENDELKLEIVDQGIGISKDNLAKIFDKYHQVSKSGTHGTGLGLSITKGLVELMGGRISIESEEGVGTAVTILLPLQSPPESSLVTEVKAELDIAAGLNVLVVEDNKINQILAKAMLENQACLVDVADDGLSGVDKATKGSFDLILMDINLPDISGLEAAERIKKHNPNANIVALTADIFVKDPNGLFNEKLTKPMTLEPLKATLHKTSQLIQQRG